MALVALNLLLDEGRAEDAVEDVGNTIAKAAGFNSIQAHED